MTEPTIPASVEIYIPPNVPFAATSEAAEALSLNEFEIVSVERMSPGWAVGATGGGGLVPDFPTAVGIFILTNLSITVGAALKRFGEHLGDNLAMRTGILNLDRKAREQADSPDRIALHIHVTSGESSDQTRVSLKIVLTDDEQLRDAAKGATRLRPREGKESLYLWRGKPRKWRRSRDRWTEREARRRRRKPHD